MFLGFVSNTFRNALKVAAGKFTLFKSRKLSFPCWMWHIFSMEVIINFLNDSLGNTDSNEFIEILHDSERVSVEIFISDQSVECRGEVRSLPEVVLHWSAVPWFVARLTMEKAFHLPSGVNLKSGVSYQVNYLIRKCRVRGWKSLVPLTSDTFQAKKSFHWDEVWSSSKQSCSSCDNLSWSSKKIFKSTFSNSKNMSTRFKII